LTGSIGTGKGNVSTMFAQLNIAVVDADQIARDVVKPGKPAHTQIAKVFGDEVFYQDQTLNRPVMGEIVFNDKDKREMLNNIIHPEIRQEMLEQRDAYVQEKEPCVVMDILLLFESKLSNYVKKILVVAVDESVQSERITTRDQLSAEDARQRMSAQIPINKKRNMAHAVIDNNGTIEESFNQLRNILTEWKIPIQNNIKKDWDLFKDTYITTNHLYNEKRKYT